MKLVKQAGYWIAAVLLAVVLHGSLAGQENPSAEKDQRGTRLQDPDHFSWSLPDPFPTRQEWDQRAKQLRLKLLLSAGLWPELEKTPLNARIFDVKQGDGFKVGKAYFESLPGFLVTGNIYFPAAGTPPYPAVLSPHGHWTYGRLQNSESGSIPGRCIDFARQGYVVFSIDMVGYNDSFQLPHDGAKSRAQLVADVPLPYEPRLFRADFMFPEAGLYGFNLGGLQLWNGIRALDFLQSLPEVDATRIGVTGASGGATQTLLLMAADDRVKVAAPVNIIGAGKHPGCGCENIPGLWVDTSTIELGATFAPRPLLLVSATQDPWTHSTPTRELPMLKKYYALFGAEDRIGNTHVKAEHNYNPESRAAVYAFFRKYLNPQGEPVDKPRPTAPEMKELGDLRVFPDMVLPQSAKAGRAIAQDWNRNARETLERAFPQGAADLASFRARFGEALALVLNVEKPPTGSLVRKAQAEQKHGDWVLARESVGRKGHGDAVDIELWRKERQPSGAIVLVLPESFGLLGGADVPPWIRTLSDSGNAVFRVRGYASGRLRIPDQTWDSLSWPDSYNRSNGLLAIQDIVTAIAAARERLPGVGITVAGFGKAGLLAAFAAAIDGGAARLIADLDGENPDYDGTLLKLLPVGSIRRVGDLRTALLLVPGRVHLLNPGPGFDGGWYQKRTGGRVTIHEGLAATDPAIARLMAGE